METLALPILHLLNLIDIRPSPNVDTKLGEHENQKSYAEIQVHAPSVNSLHLESGELGVADVVKSDDLYGYLR